MNNRSCLFALITIHLLALAPAPTPLGGATLNRSARGHASGVGRPRVLQIGAEPPHATMMVYPDAALARERRRERSPGFQSLNGRWKFNYAKSPAARPVDFARADFADASWPEIRVPANWESRASACRSTPIRGIRSSTIVATRASPSMTTRWARTGGRSPFRRRGKDAGCSCTLPASTPRSTSGSTAFASATTRTAERRPSSTSPTG